MLIPQPLGLRMDQQCLNLFEANSAVALGQSM
jgi:hypothetical protein